MQDIQENKQDKENRSTSIATADSVVVPVPVDAATLTLAHLPFVQPRKKSTREFPKEVLQLGETCRVWFQYNHKRIPGHFLHVDEPFGGDRFLYRGVVCNTAAIFRFVINGSTRYFTRPTALIQCVMAEDQKKDRLTCTGKGWGPIYLDLPDDKDGKISLSYYRKGKYNGPGFKNDPTITQEQRDAWCIEARKWYAKPKFVHVLSEVDELLDAGFLPAQVNDELGRRFRLNKPTENTTDKSNPHTNTDIDTNTFAKSDTTNDQKALVQLRKQQKIEVRLLKKQAREQKKGEKRKQIETSSSDDHPAKRPCPPCSSSSVAAAPLLFDFTPLRQLSPVLMGQLIQTASEILIKAYGNAKLWKQLCESDSSIVCYSLLRHHPDMDAIKAHHYQYETAASLASLVITSDAIVESDVRTIQYDYLASVFQYCVQCIYEYVLA